MAETPNLAKPQLAEVDLAVLMYERLTGEPYYTPAPGTRYEVGPGVWVELLPPTRGLSKRFRDKQKELESEDRTDPYPDATLAKMVTKGDWPDEDEYLDNVIAAIVVDFASASSLTTRSEIQLLRASNLLNVLDLRTLLSSSGLLDGNNGKTGEKMSSGS